MSFVLRNLSRLGLIALVAGASFVLMFGLSRGLR